jgi:NlpC/P60 family putative phage cell wall peptidase
MTERDVSEHEPEHEHAQRIAVAREALTWLGTAYHHHARIKGVGVDCVQLLCAVYEACGLVAPIATGTYATDWHLHRSEEIYASSCSRYAQRVDAPRLGDVALYKFGRCFSHGGIVVDHDLVLHAYLGRGVIMTRFSEDPLMGREVQFFSPWRPRP